MIVFWTKKIHRYFWHFLMKKSHHKITSKTPIWTPKIKSNNTLCYIVYFSKKKKLNFQMINSGQNEKIYVWKAFIFRIYNMFYLRTASKSIRRLVKIILRKIVCKNCQNIKNEHILTTTYHREKITQYPLNK